MSFSRPSSHALLVPPPDGSFQYWRPTAGGVIELGVVRGREVALPTHFHDETRSRSYWRGAGGW